MRRLAVAALTAAAIAVGAAPPALAGADTGTDSTGDVVAMRRNGYGPANAPFADIVKLRSIHSLTQVVIKTTYAELVSKPRQILYEGYDVITDDGTEYSGQLIYTAEHGVSSVLLLGEHGTSKGCFERALTGRVNPRKALVTFVIPARCLHHPAWVRTGAGSFVVIDSGKVSYRDDARAPYRIPDPGGIYIQPTYGPQL